MKTSQLVASSFYRMPKVKLTWLVENWRTSPEFVQFCKDSYTKNIGSPICETDAGNWLLEISFQSLQNQLLTGNQVMKCLVFKLIKKTTEKIPNLLRIKGFMEITAIHLDGNTGHELESWRIKRHFDQLLENEMFIADHENACLIPLCCTSLKISAEFIVGGWSPKIHTVPTDSKEIDSESVLSLDFSTLLEDKDFTDVIVIVEGQSFSAHKAVLAARSPVLGAMLRSNMREKQEGSIKLEDISSVAWAIFQRFLYSGTFCSDAEYELEIFCELLMISDKYSVPSLVPHLEEGIIRKLSPDNVFDVYKMVQLFQVARVKSVAVDILLNCWEEIDNERKKEIVTSVPSLATTLLEKLKV